MTQPLDRIFKAYDIRGIYPDELNEDIAYRIGYAAAKQLGREILVGRDMRLSSDNLFSALIRGILDSGSDAIDCGLVSTDALYFGVGRFGLPGGIMITASHNPPEYNGFKICGREATPVSGASGLPEIKQMVSKGEFPRSKQPGRMRRINLLSPYIKHILSFVERGKIAPLRILIDAGNGMAGKVVPLLFEHLPCRLTGMYFELDGSFPHHLANPIIPDNTIELRRRVVEEKFDLGAAFDGDADRVFLVDERGELIGGDMLLALILKGLLEKNPGAAVVYNLICSRVVPELIEEYGGIPIRSRVGHAFIKPLMRKHNAIIGGEHSGHFYFRNNYFADSGLIALAIALEVISKEKKPLSELISEFDRYYRSGEINSRVSDQKGKMDEVEQEFLREGFKLEKLDGLSVIGDDVWFNLRPSNTEPLLRLNVEGKTRELVDRTTEEVIRILKR